MGWQLELFKKAYILVFIALLSACATAPKQQDTVRVGGFWEQDENTDPRFVQVDRPPDAVIGTLRVAGGNVFLNGRHITAPVRIRNHAHLRTGFRSGARVEFYPGTHGFCRIAILELHTGRGYGNTAQCLHQMRTPQSSGFTDPNTVYHVSVNDWQTEITVIHGRLESWLNSDPKRRVAITDAQEILLTPDEIIGPRPVSPAEIKRRTSWRSKFTFYRPAPVDDSKTRPQLEKGIGTGLEWLFEKIRDRDEKPPSDTEPDTDSIRDPQTSPQRQPPSRMRIILPETLTRPPTDSSDEDQQQIR